MARRPESAESDRPFTRDELTELEHRMALLSRYHVVKAYREAYERCRMTGELLPCATAVQELVTAWKVLWRAKRTNT